MNKALEQLGEDRYNWWKLYCTRKERLARLTELGAPAAIIAKEREMVKDAENMCRLLAYRE